MIISKPELKDFFIRHCFDATYEQVLLSNVYGLDDDTLGDMVFAKNVRVFILLFQVLHSYSVRSTDRRNVLALNISFHFLYKVDGVDVGWTLGWAIVAATDQTCPGDWKKKRSLSNL